MAHLTFLFFCFCANIIVTSLLLLGGAATVEALTGMDYRLASFLIPWGVILYTASGGLQATFLASYIHTVIIFGVLITMVFLVRCLECHERVFYGPSIDSRSMTVFYRFTSSSTRPIRFTTSLMRLFRTASRNAKSFSPPTVPPTQPSSSRATTPAERSRVTTVDPT